METDVRTSSSVEREGGLRRRVADWVLLHGDRWVVTAGIVAVVVLVVAALIRVGILAVGPGGYAATLFGSGLTSGVLTLMTVALSINQLILSRVFGSPNELAARLEGTRELRRTVEEHAGASSSPNDPAAFLSLLGATLGDRTADLLASAEASEWAPPVEFASALQDVVDYGRSIDDNLEGEADVVDVLDVVLGSEYARNMRAVDHLRGEYADVVPVDVRGKFRPVDELLECVAVARQFFKTLSLQQDFAHLSRVVVYSGLLALMATISLTLVYRTNAVTIPASVLPVVVSLGVRVIISPLAAFVAYVLRAATVAHRTVSVGPFVPPEAR